MWTFSIFTFPLTVSSIIENFKTTFEKRLKEVNSRYKLKQKIRTLTKKWKQL